MRQWCDKCGEYEATHKYRDTIYGTDTEITVFVCPDCTDELEKVSSGKNCPIQLTRIHDATADLFDPLSRMYDR